MKNCVRAFGIVLLLLLGYGAGAQVMFATDSTKKSFGKRRLMPLVYYANPDRIFAGLRYNLNRPGTSNFEHSVQLRYSISQNAFSALYDATLHNAVGKWDLSFNAYYDWLVWTNFFGLGNDTRRVNDITYYRLSTSEYAGNLSLHRLFAQHHYVDFTAYLQGIEVFGRPNTLIEQSYINNRDYYFEHHIYTSLRGSYTYQDVDDHILPTKGVMLYGGAGFTANTYDFSKSFAKLNGIAQFYIPLSPKFSLALRGGAAGITGTPEFYQYVSVGGPMTIRGYYRDRFWGNAMVYNNNELRYITNLRTGKYHNKIGLLAFVDDGRVWYKGENSNTLHYGYGGGILVSPAHKFTGQVTYGRSDEGNLIQFKFSKLLNTFPASRMMY